MGRGPIGNRVKWDWGEMGEGEMEKSESRKGEL
jgi:hypothetical protein